MRAIQVKVIPATSTKPTRYRASSERSHVTMSTAKAYDLATENSPEGHHFEVVKALCLKLGWDGELVCGWFGNESYWVFRGSEGRNAFLLPPINHKDPLVRAIAQKQTEKGGES
jgi:hypothetical protein